MKWFKHDSDANTDTKLKKVRHKYGIQGYGLYWYCVELIAGSLSAENITFELEEDAEIIALEWNLDQLKVQEIMSYMASIGLFDISENNRIRCLKLAKRLDDTNSKNPQIRELVNKINNSEKLRETPSKSAQNRLDKIRLDNKNHLSNPSDLTYEDYPEFIEFWNAYPRKDDKKKSFKAWLKTNPNIDLVLNALAWQKESDQWNKGNGQFIPLGESYINGARWEAEPIEQQEAAF